MKDPENLPMRERLAAIKERLEAVESFLAKRARKKPK